MIDKWIGLKFTPLEFETTHNRCSCRSERRLKFTPLEFETGRGAKFKCFFKKLKFTPLEFETNAINDFEATATR